MSPGVIKTNFSKMLWQDQGVADAVSAQTMLGRLGTPEDVAGVRVVRLDADGNARHAIMSVCCCAPNRSSHFYYQRMQVTSLASV